MFIYKKILLEYSRAQYIILKVICGNITRLKPKYHFILSDLTLLSWAIRILYNNQEVDTFHISNFNPLYHLIIP